MRSQRLVRIGLSWYIRRELLLDDGSVGMVVYLRIRDYIRELLMKSWEARPVYVAGVVAFASILFAILQWTHGRR